MQCATHHAKCRLRLSARPFRSLCCVLLWPGQMHCMLRTGGVCSALVHRVSYVPLQALSQRCGSRCFVQDADGALRLHLMEPVLAHDPAVVHDCEQQVEQVTSREQAASQTC